MTTYIIFPAQLKKITQLKQIFNYLFFPENKSIAAAVMA